MRNRCVDKLCSRYFIYYLYLYFEEKKYKINLKSTTFVLSRGTKQTARNINMSQINCCSFCSNLFQIIKNTATHFRTNNSNKPNCLNRVEKQMISKGFGLISSPRKHWVKKKRKKNLQQNQTYLEKLSAVLSWSLRKGKTQIGKKKHWNIWWMTKHPHMAPNWMAWQLTILIDIFVAMVMLVEHVNRCMVGS